ncbi:imidazole glycerol phosphate synthase, glutamine amidotransferase subunit [Rheinheimera sp. SA_1]|uniref:imidazole glycerol phosphate synthase subunit HisH n=1 Tax=Rheinheimera sp. SA_1 TaxID=1827365 RepID=UPI0007FD87BE|nr:imidazole glycerol phosphate synthase subunit HisH [Rheinheimera sp. SA_1]OBP15524.1 imidazole glycerol phosphate synthase, glutamine amidotransferase subunit [Rheinheimera sp. SA_1]
MTDLLAKNAQTSLVIVDTGCANITSVYCAIERLGCRVSISSDAAVIQSADKVIIPGVGTASQAMANISAKNLVEVLQNLKQPTLGICLGMQLMTDYSAEGDVACLGLIPGQVLPLEAKGLRLPHMGWNTLTKTVDHALLQGLNSDDYVYFVHSFAVAPSELMLASCDYGSQFAAIIGKGNYLGMQFHPERSSSVGRKLLQNFITLSAADLATK